MKVDKGGMSVPCGPTGVLSSSRGGTATKKMSARPKGNGLKGTQMKQAVGKKMTGKR